MTDIIKLLNEELSPSFVKERNQAGINLKYIEGYNSELNANRIFKYSWDKEILSQDKLYERSYKNSKGNDMIEVAYSCRIRVCFKIDGQKYFRDGSGFGNGQASIGQPSQAHELAIKESETDGLKRALKSLGKQFGLGLYDKEIEVKETYETAVRTSLELKEAIEVLNKCKTKEEVREAFKNYNGQYKNEFEKACFKRGKELNNENS